MSASRTPFELKIRTATACLLLFSHIGLATAADGRVEISQACAEVGCFDGDTAGFPVHIANPGSYVLTSDLDITGVGSPHNRMVIVIQTEANGTVISLNIFRPSDDVNFQSAHQLGPNLCGTIICP